VRQEREEVAFVDGRRQWSVPLSVALGAVTLIGFWPAPNQVPGIGATEQSSTTVGAVVTEEYVNDQREPDLATEVAASESPHSPPTQGDEIVPLGPELLMLEKPISSSVGTEPSDEITTPTTDPVSEQPDEQDLPFEDSADLGSVEEPEEEVDVPTGADVLQVVRWVGGAIALSTPAEPEVASEVSQVARLAWQAQRQAVSEGTQSTSWNSAHAYRTGFARVLAETLMMVVVPPDETVVLDSAFTVTDVRIDVAGRAIVSFCLVEDSGFGSFSDTQGTWGLVTSISGSIGLVNAVGGWTVDDVARVSGGAQC